MKQPREEQILALEEALADNNNPMWAELGRIMAEDIRKRIMPLGERIKAGIREEIGKRK